MKKVAHANIPFLAGMAKTHLVVNKGYKWSDFKQPLDMGEGTMIGGLIDTHGTELAKAKQAYKKFMSTHQPLGTAGDTV